jgi:hypothetical protein
MKGTRLALAALVTLAALTPSTVSAHGDHSDHTNHSDHSSHGQPSSVKLAQVRLATAKYLWLRKAERDGYKDLGLCVDMMGEHWVNTDSNDGDTAPDVFQDGVLDRRHPEALVYAHRGEHLQLVAVEWVSTEPGTVPGIGDLHLNSTLGVYVLHAWIWKHNPDGVLADMNPRIGDCP